MKKKDLVFDTAMVGVSAALLWHLSNIWRYGQHLIQEPNIVILSLETAGLLLILAFRVTRLVITPRRKKGIEIKTSRVLSQARIDNWERRGAFKW